MKLVAIFVIIFITGTQCTSKDPHEAKIDACVKSSGVTPESVSELKGEVLNDPKVKAYVFCVHKAVGFQNEEGELQIDPIKAKLTSEGMTQQELDDIIKKCAKNKETGEETAVEWTKCVRDNTSH